jgi:hypothetical protein
MEKRTRLTIASTLAGLALLTQMGAAQAAQPDQSPARRLFFPRGSDTVERTGVLRSGGTDRYVIRLGQNDDFIVTAASPRDNAILVIWGADGTVLISDHADALHWSGVTPKTQDYFIDVHAIDGTSANYTLIVTARPIKPYPPHPGVRRIIFPPGSVSTTVSGKVVPGGPNAYVLRGQENQLLQVNVTAEEQKVSLSIDGADGTVLLSPSAGATSFREVLTKTQDYFIKVQIDGAGFAFYSMTVILESPVY